MVRYEHVSSCNLYKVIFKLLDKITEILVSNGSHFLLFIAWPFGTESQRGSQPLLWSSHIIPWFWRDDLPLVQTMKLQRNFRGDILLTVLGLPVFPNIVPSRTCHVHRCQLLFPERLPIGETVINIWWWCYNW